METYNRPKLLYPSMVIAAVAVTVFSLLGIATLTGALPFAHSQTGSGYVADQDPDADQGVPGKTPSQHLARTCANCGVVESIQAVEVKGQGSGVGAVAGGLTGALLGNGVGQGNGRTAATLLGAAGGAYAGNEIEKNTKKHTSYQIRVRMQDGTTRTLHQRQVPGVANGDHVKIVNGMLVEES